MYRPEKCVKKTVISVKNLWVKFLIDYFNNDLYLIIIDIFWKDKNKHQRDLFNENLYPFILFNTKDHNTIQ